MPELSDAVTRTVIIGSRVGLHARPASLFVQASAKTKQKVTLTTAAGGTTDGASILGVLALGIGSGDSITLTVVGDSAEEAADSLAALLESDLDAA